jgi:hypothetical protein
VEAIRFVLSDTYAHLTREERQQLLHVCPFKYIHRRLPFRKARELL